MGNAPGSDRRSTPPSSPPPPPRVPRHSHPRPNPHRRPLFLPLYLPHRQFLFLPHYPQLLSRITLRSSRPYQSRRYHQHGSCSQSRMSAKPNLDWAAARAVMECAVLILRNCAEEIARETMERRREQRAMEEEEARTLHERKMTIDEDAEPDLFDELRFPPGLEREGSESEASAMFHSSESTADTLVEDSEQVMNDSDKGDLEKLLEKLQVQEVQEAATVIVQEGAAPVKELAALPEEPVILEPSQVSSEELAEEVAMVDEEAEESEASQEAMPIVQETPIDTEDHSTDEVPLVSSDRPSSLLEEASDTQTEHLTSSGEFPHPDTPHPGLDDTRAASPVPFPVISELEDQGYGTQGGEHRTTQTQERAPAYVRPQEEEEHVEELPSPPFSRLLLPVPAPAEPPRDLRADCGARFAAARRAVQQTSRKLEPGLYTATDIRWGLALDLSGADGRSLIAFGPHGWENQQWEFQSCGAGFVIKSISAGLFLSLEDLQGLHRDGSAEVVAGQFPMCWEMEIMDNGGADNEEYGQGDVYARIRLPHTEMALGFNGGYAGAQLFLTKDANNMSTFWRLRAPRREQVVKSPPISTTETIRQGGMTTLITTTSVTSTTTRTVTRIVTGDA